MLLWFLGQNYNHPAMLGFIVKCYDSLLMCVWLWEKKLYSMCYGHESALKVMICTTKSYDLLWWIIIKNVTIQMLW